MSVCNIYFHEDKILCLSDTVLYQKNKPAGLSKGKTFTLPNGDGAWCFRGRTRVSMGVEFLIKTRVNNRFDDIVGSMEYFSEFLSPEISDDNYAEITLMGYSAMEENLKVVRYRLLPDGAISDPIEIGYGLHLQPSPGNSLKLPEVVTEDMMVRLALAQYKVAECFNLPMCIGGLMHLTTITEFSTERRIIGAYPNYDELKRKFECQLSDEFQEYLNKSQSRKDL